MRRCATGLVLLLAVAGSSGAGESPRWVPEETFGERGRGRHELADPVAVALTPGGDVAVLDRSREAVVLFDDSGSWRRTLGGPRGEGVVDLREPAGLAVDGQGRFWIADRGNHRVVVLDEAGTVVQTVGSLGARDGRFRHPGGVTFDRQGRLYVADSGNERVQVFSAAGKFLASWDRRTGGRRDHLETPAELAFSDHGRGGIWVLNRAWSRLERFDLDGEWEETRTLPPEVTGPVDLVAVTVEPTYYRMFLTDRAGGRIVVLDHRGRWMAEVGAPGEASWAPAGTAVNRAFDLFVADTAGARVVKYEIQ